MAHIGPKFHPTLPCLYLPLKLFKTSPIYIARN